MSPQDRYLARRNHMILCIVEHDWHGVQDCATDIRELVAAHPELRRMEEKLWSRK